VNGSLHCIFICLGPLFPEFLKIKTILLRFEVHCCLFARYFDEDDEHVTPTSTLEYIPAPGSPSYQPQGGQSSDSEEDPLDAFMAGIEREVQRETVKLQEKEDKKKGIRDDIEEEDVEESYYR